MTSRHEFTSEQILDAIAEAIRARDLDAVPGLVALLAIQDPAAAQAVLDTVEAARMLTADRSEATRVPR